MKTRLLIIIGIVIILAIIFGVLIIIDSGLRPFKEHYQIEITGLKETYLVGEPYSFSFILSGYGYSCGGMSITWPINKTNNLNDGWIPGCTQSLLSDFVYDEKKEHGRTYGHIALQESGNYTVKVTFEKGSNGPTVATKSFLVVDDVSTDYDDTLDKKSFIVDKYGKVKLDGSDALDICGAVRLPCPTNPTFPGKMLDENNVLVMISGTSDFDVKLNQTHVCVTSKTKTTCEIRK
jgi:hypothetical protein